ncbi:unnamed protein product [Parnassius apollo]|uniref:(apollo) hypothetical protein n=1 Tax=Parnassius apollo TaxID=110799 RepID=A0A8S3XH62_PARAO|nr:unnamed protein product [Parnassius apollo]
MFKALILLVSLTTVLAETDLHKFEGEWYHVATYSAASDLHTCDLFNITLNGMPCECEGRPASGLKFSMVTLPVIVVKDYSEVEAALARNCTTLNVMKTMAVRLVNDNFFVAYEKCYKCTEKEPNTANLMAKFLPSKKELESLEGIDELKGRRSMTCYLIQ